MLEACRESRHSGKMVEKLVEGIAVQVRLQMVEMMELVEDGGVGGDGGDGGDGGVGGDGGDGGVGGKIGANYFFAQRISEKVNESY